MSRLTPSLPRFLLPPLTMVLLLALVSCNEQSDPLAPWPAATAGGAVAGTLRVGNTAVADAVVCLEPMLEGVPLSVTARIAPDTAVAKSAGDRVRVTTSDERGWYAITGLDAGDYLLSILSNDHLGGNREVGITAEAVARAETTYVDIDLVPTGTFTGNATLQNETDHASTVVYVTGTANVAVTDEAGDYTLTAVPTGTHTIRATHTGWLDQTTVGTLAAAGEAVDLTALALPRTANIPPTASILPLPALPVQNVYEAIPFEATASDLDGTIVLVEWDFEDDGTFDHSGPSALTVNWPVTTAGSYRAKVRVTDDHGDIGLAVLEFSVYRGIFVWGEEGDDANPGNESEPVQTIQQGITLAEVLGLPVIVHTGTYPEAVQFKSNVSVWGGYDRELGWTRPPGSYSQIWLQSFYQHFAMAQNVSQATITGLEIQAETAQGDATNAIALKIIDSDATLVFQDCRIIAGNATAALTAGFNGDSGPTGGSGEPGQDGFWRTTQSERLLGGAGGDGENSGHYGGYGGWDTYQPTGGYGPTGGVGGWNETSCFGGSAGHGGNAMINGGAGMYGQNADAMNAYYGTIVAQTWTGTGGNPGYPGTAGEGGSGGGGGGAVWVGACYLVGPSGGGGGGGGGHGRGGYGGQHGGAAIAVLCINSSAVIDSCLIQTGDGGNGWRGGNGGQGGSGGFGAIGGAYYYHSPTDARTGSAGYGSNGGPGGDGGGGQGGHGGPSIGVFSFNGAAPTLTDITWSIGSGGAGGPGGWHGNGATQAPTGPSGPAVQVYDHP